MSTLALHSAIRTMGLWHNSREDREIEIQLQTTFFGVAAGLIVNNRRFVLGFFGVYKQYQPKLASITQWAAIGTRLVGYLG